VNIQGVVNGVKVCSDSKINVIRQVLNLHNTRETDFDSDVVTTWLEPGKRRAEENIHESMSRCVPTGKKLIAGRFLTFAVQEKQILILLW
jgi:hypothetical protein